MKFNYPRRKDAVLWSARVHTQSLVASSSSSSTLSGSYSLITGEEMENKENVFSNQQQQQQQQQSSRVRYIADDIRTRKITNTSIQFAQYQKALEEQSLTLTTVSGDGNCLFRSVAHQIYGDENLHEVVRQKCMDYMESEIDFFSQFIVGGRESFHLYIQAKRMNACWGDDPEIEVC
jgi:TolA-binding protein